MKLVSIICLSICLILLSVSAPAQILDVRRAVKNKVINRVNNQIDKEIDKEIDKVENFAVDASRIETDGKGETAPVAANDTPTNKALNRRVEFIKL